MAARRKADRLIASGTVSVNGIPAVAGQQVTPGVDTVLVDGRPVEPALNWTYLMMNKPVGVLTSVGDDRGRETVTDRLPNRAPRVFPVGRLDLDSRGLLLLTDDGELAGPEASSCFGLLFAGRSGPIWVQVPPLSVVT